MKQLREKRLSIGKESGFHAISPEKGLGGGILLMLAGVFCYAVMSVAARQLGGSYSVSQILLFRCLAALPLLPLLAWHAGGATVLKTRQPHLHAFRILLGLGSMYAIFKSFAVLPLADAMALIFTYPLIMTALSAFMLGERVGTHQWLAIAAGFAGMLTVVKPGAGFLIASEAFYPLTAAVLMAVSLIEGRRITRTDHPASIIFWFTWIGVIAGAAGCAVEGFIMPNGQDLALFCVVGIAGGMGQYLVAQALRIGEVSRVAPLEYTRLIWGAMFGWLLLGEVPETHVWVGAGILVASGLYNSWQRRPLLDAK